MHVRRCTAVKEGETYCSQLLVDSPKLLLVSRVRPAAHQDLVPPFDPALCRRLSEIDLLPFVPACVCIEKDPARHAKTTC